MPERNSLIQGINHVELRVRNLAESAAFYRQVLGLECRDAQPPNRRVCVCVGWADSGDEFGLVLAEGLPLTAQPTGLDHVSVWVRSEDDVRAIHSRADEIGARRTAPRVFDGAYQFFVFDPNGYKLEIASRIQANAE